MRQEASELGRVIDEKTFRAAEHFRDNLTRLRGAVEGLAFKVAEQLLPHLIRFTDQMVQFVKDVDLSKLARQLQDVAEWLKNIGLWIVTYAVVTRLINFANAARTAALAIGAMNLAILANPWGLAAAQGSKEQREKFAALGVEFKNQDGTLRSANAVHFLGINKPT